MHNFISNLLVRFSFQIIKTIIHLGKNTFFFVHLVRKEKRLQKTSCLDFDHVNKTTRVTPKLMPSILLFKPTTSEAAVEDMVAESKPPCQ